MTDVAIIDNGGANIASLRHALERLGASSVLTTDVAILRGAPRVLLPGVGAAADAMERLRAAGLVEAIRVLEQPVLGICLGMQLLFGRSEEGDTACLGIIDGRVGRFADAPDLPVPHMGWNRLAALTPDPLLDGLRAGEHVYFVHSYRAPLGPGPWPPATTAADSRRWSASVTSPAHSSTPSDRVRPAHACSRIS